MYSFGVVLNKTFSVDTSEEAYVYIHTGMHGECSLSTTPKLYTLMLINDTVTFIHLQ